MTSLAFIRIYDFKADKEYIYNHSPVNKNNISDVVQKIYNTLSSFNKNLKMDGKDDKYEIYENITVEHRGWIWKDTHETKNILYKLSIIPLISFGEQTVDKFSQTCEKDIKENVFENSKPKSNLNYGYSNNFIFPDLRQALVDELKQKLSQPNFGLLFHQ